jgi:hypothetical protein
MARPSLAHLPGGSASAEITRVPRVFSGDEADVRGTASGDASTASRATYGDRPIVEEVARAGSNAASTAGAHDDAAVRKSPKTGAGVTRRQGSGPLQGFIHDIRDSRRPTGDEDAALGTIPLTLLPAVATQT